MATVFALVTAALCITFAAVQSTAKEDTDKWRCVEKLFIRTASLIPLFIGLCLYYGGISSEQRTEVSLLLIIFSILLLVYAFFLARLNFLFVFITWNLSIMLTLVTAVILVSIWQMTLLPLLLLLLPLIAFGALYVWIIGKGLFTR